MDYLFYSLFLGINDQIEVIIDKHAYVRLMDSNNYSKYRNNQRYSFYGGLITNPRSKMQPPYPGDWILVIDCDGKEVNVNAEVNILG